MKLWLRGDEFMGDWLYFFIKRDYCPQSKDTKKEKSKSSSSEAEASLGSADESGSGSGSE